mgnify:CR=1 FL=1
MNDIDEGTRYVTLELHDAQLERIVALIERNLARQEAIAANMRADISELKGELKAINAKVDGLEKKFDARIDGLEKKVDARIDGLEKKVDARIDGLEDAIAMTNMRIDDLKSQQSNTLTRWGIIIAVGVCVVQVITSIVLQFIH